LSYPAFAAFFTDPGITSARIQVFMALQPDRALALDFVRPVDVKTEAVARAARVSKGAAVDALAWLVRHGYLVQHGRDGRGIRSVTLAYAVPVARSA